VQLSKEDRAILTSQEKFSRRERVFCSDGDKSVGDSRSGLLDSFHGNALKLRRVLFVYSSSSSSDDGERGHLDGLSMILRAGRSSTVAPCSTSGVPARHQCTFSTLSMLPL
jgi:hypothetical protein